jgi:hypothetical protein
MVRTLSMDSGRPLAKLPAAGEASMHGVGTFRLNTKYPACRLHQLNCGGNTGTEAAPANRDNYRIKLGNLST